MASRRALAWIEALAWTLLYGGLFTLAIGAMVRRADAPLGWTIAGCALAAAALGVALIAWRSRLREDAAEPNEMMKEKEST
ncbi:hypothetical protein [Ramlibacter rhizophilus]|uniref:Uncharacterized protein n=1 Tax=Ramlibacter rhizophilus TaxID=1781167 RepID=A0A4Z0C343_9BURK|nr:hypothetical protein [Ramlibacter rhizophilus]TFZ04908.1 hypothetical protein EZ242_03945 [Ramlibacter rhizophilus]